MLVSMGIYKNVKDNVFKIHVYKHKFNYLLQSYHMLNTSTSSWRLSVNNEGHLVDHIV